jgi:hypothetical protein
LAEVEKVLEIIDSARIRKSKPALSEVENSLPAISAEVLA